jgi:predicted ATPase
MEGKIVQKALKIDLHIHSIFSKNKDGDKVKNNTKKNIKTLINKLNFYNVNMCAITDHDYFDYDLYKLLKLEENKENIKKVLPGFEASVVFKGDEGEKVIHVITIFDDIDDKKLKSLNKLLIDDKGKVNYDRKEISAFSENKYLEILKNTNLSVVLIGHQKNSVLSKGKNKDHDILTLGKRTFEELIFADYFDAFEFKNRKNEVFNRIYMSQMRKEIKTSDVKFITSSDCHSWDLYPKMGKDDKDEDYPFTFLKCLPSFKGLVMSVTDYRRIKTNESFFSGSSRYLEKIKYKINGIEKEIELSKGINVIIGDNSVGKSLLVHALTEWENTPKDLKPKYEKYLQDNDLNIVSMIPKDNILLFDIQGEIRESFANGKLKAKEFLNQYFPEKPNVLDIKDSIKNNIEEYLNSLSNKISFEEKRKGLKSFKIVTEENSDTLTFAKYIKRKNLMVYTDIIDYFDNLIQNYRSLLSVDRIAGKDKKLLSKHLTSIEKMKLKYIDLKKKDNFENEIIQIIVNKINDVDKILISQKSDSDKIIDSFNKEKIIFKDTIIELFNLQNNVIELVPKTKNLNIPISCNIIDIYRFITKTNVERITKEYVNNLIKKRFLRKIIPDFEQITKTLLIEKLAKYDSENYDDPIEFMRDSISADIDSDFTFRNVINNKDDEDIYSELSSGFNSRIYFDILSKQTSKDGIYIIDQPEDDVSQKSIKEFLLDDFKEMSNNRQVIIITHNPQFIVNLDVDNVIYIYKNEKKAIDIRSGALEYEKDYNVLSIIADNIDGGIETINKRWKRYDKTIKND